MKLMSVVDGKTKYLEEVNDEAFSQKMMGDGIAVVPSVGKVYAPASGRVSMLFPTYHAIGLILTAGVEVLIHIGIEDVYKRQITCYRQGDFVDLCRGPHVETVKMCKNFKLLKHSGAYWKGYKDNKVLQRIYGVCFPTPEELQAYLDFLEEAKKRDHKKLGRELDLFMMSEYAPGMPFFLPHGMLLRNELEKFWYDEHTKEGYEFIKTPIMMSKALWEVSGHWYNYKENMYTTLVDEREFAIKPMNCPGSLLVYKNGLHSYKDLPIRMGELGQVHRHEASGALNGLFRVRTFTQDDAHIFMTPDQIESCLLYTSRCV